MRIGSVNTFLATRAALGSLSFIQYSSCRSNNAHSTLARFGIYLRSPSFLELTAAHVPTRTVRHTCSDNRRSQQHLDEAEKIIPKARNSSGQRHVVDEDYLLISSASCISAQRSCEGITTLPATIIFEFFHLTRSQSMRRTTSYDTAAETISTY